MTDQELPDCHRYPHLKCPGECQYILGRTECQNADAIAITNQIKSYPEAEVDEDGTISEEGAIKFAMHHFGITREAATEYINRGIETGKLRFI
jgi:hypothetical protein